MYPLETGQDAEMAREKLNLTQQEMANSVGISLRTWRRQATSGQLNLTISLAIECLLRRRAVSSQTAVTPEERAERKFREQRRLLELRRAAGLPAGRASLTPAEVAARQVEIAEERKRLRDVRARNRRRDEERLLISELHARLKPLPLGSRERDAALTAARMAASDIGQHYLAHYCNEAGARILADDDPLVTLPLESEQ